MQIQYKTRYSKRAKHLQIQASHSKGIEVVIPFGFSEAAVRKFVSEKKNWIARILSRLEKTKPIKQLINSKLPDHVYFPAIDRLYKIEYSTKSSSITAARIKPGHIISVTGCNLIKERKRALKRLIRRLARQELSELINRLSQEHNLRFEKLCIKSQRTVWGSCSSKNIINLNQNLLFLPSHLAEHVLIHELCHLKHLNHSKKYWNTVQSIAPSFKKLEKELKSAWRYVPAWVTGS